MIKILADSVVCFHVFFVIFVLFGGFLVMRWPWLVWVHLPCAIWGVMVEINGWICPLTYLENYLRLMSHEAGYSISFIERYCLPLIYPELWFPGGFPAWGFPIIGGLVLVLNAVVYAKWRRR